MHHLLVYNSFAFAQVFPAVLRKLLETVISVPTWCSLPVGLAVPYRYGPRGIPFSLSSTCLPKPFPLGIDSMGPTELGSLFRSISLGVSMQCAQFQAENQTLCSKPGKTAQVTPLEPPLTSRAGPGKSHRGPAHRLSQGQGDLPGSSTVPKTHVSESHEEHSVWHKSKSIEQVHSRA